MVDTAQRRFLTVLYRCIIALPVFLLACTGHHSYLVLPEVTIAPHDPATNVILQTISKTSGRADLVKVAEEADNPTIYTAATSRLRSLFPLLPVPVGINKDDTSYEAQLYPSIYAGTKSVQSLEDQHTLDTIARSMWGSHAAATHKLLPNLMEAQTRLCAAGAIQNVSSLKAIVRLWLGRDGNFFADRSHSSHSTFLGDRMTVVLKIREAIERSGIEQRTGPLRIVYEIEPHVPVQAYNGGGIWAMGEDVTISIETASEVFATGRYITTFPERIVTYATQPPLGNPFFLLATVDPQRLVAELVRTAQGE